MPLEPITITAAERAGSDSRQAINLMEQFKQQLAAVLADKPAVEAREAQPRVHPQTGQVLGMIPAQPAKEAVSNAAILSKLGQTNAAAAAAILGALAPAVGE